MKVCRARSCRKEFKPRNSLQAACSEPCSIEVSRAATDKRVRRERTVQRGLDRAALERLKTVPQLKKEAQREFNRFIRTRDEGKPCICCGRLPRGDAFTGGSWDAGHYRSTGAADHLRFNEDNCHRQLSNCNVGRGGNGGNYRRGLIARIGLKRVEALEDDNGTHKWTRDELRAIRDEYRVKWRELAKAQARAAGHHTPT
jgi:hypothetical protein